MSNSSDRFTSLDEAMKVADQASGSFKDSLKCLLGDLVNISGAKDLRYEFESPQG